MGAQFEQSLAFGLDASVGDVAALAWSAHRVELVGVLVVVHARILDRDGKFIPGLQASDFQVLEDGVPQQIVTFTTESEGGEVILALDGSGSMEQAVGELRAAAVAERRLAVAFTFASSAALALSRSSVTRFSSAV